MPLIDETPKLTLYRDGLANLNGAAGRALGRAVGVNLAAPGAPGGRWQLLPVDYEQPGMLTLYTSDRGAQRFRAYALATAVFALLPESQKKFSMTLNPTAGNRFWLVAA